VATFPPRPEGRGFQVDIKGVLADEIKDYVVIDDAGDNGYTDVKNLITVDGSVGLTKEDILKANKIFKRNKRKRKPA
jgi:hypothetical protein